MNTVNIFKNSFVGLALFSGFIATLLGFYRLPVENYDFHQSNEVIIFISIILIIETLSRFYEINRIYSGFIVILISSVILNALIPLIFVIYFFVSSFSLGLIFVNYFFKNRVSYLSILLIGLSVYGLMIGISSHFSVNNIFTYITILLIPILFTRIKLLNLSSLFIEKYDSNSEFKYYDLIIIALGVLYFFVSLMPEIGHDALATHLFIPGHIEANGFWGYKVESYVWALSPMLGDWLITVPYILSGETASRIFNIFIIFLICFLILEIIEWLEFPKANGRYALLIFLSSPLTYSLGSTIFVEPIWGIFFIAGFFSFLKIIHDKQYSLENFSTAGIFFGSALAIKAITLIYLPILLLITAFQFRNIFIRSNILKILSSICLILIFGAKTYLLSWWITGNPVFPFFNSFFESPFFDTGSNFNNPTWYKGISWDLFYQITFNSINYTEAKMAGVGFHLLLLTLPAIFILNLVNSYKSLIILFFSLVSIWVTFEFTAYLRYTFPSQILLIILSSLIISQLKNIHKYFFKITKFLFLLTILLNLTFLESGYGLKKIDFKIIRNENLDREHYYSIYLPQRLAVEELNKININNSPVGVFAPSMMAGLKSDALYPSWYNVNFIDSIIKSINHTLMIDNMNYWGIEYIIYDKNWKGIGEGHKVLITEISNEIDSFGTISIRKINYDSHFYNQFESESLTYNSKEELLINNDFSELNNWNYVSKNIYNSEEIIVTHDLPVTQIVEINSREMYKYEVVARCKDNKYNNSEGRLQINWLDADKEFLKTDIKVFNCTRENNSYSMILRSPNLAKYAAIFITGHTGDPIVFSSASLR